MNKKRVCQNEGGQLGGGDGREGGARRQNVRVHLAAANEREKKRKKERERDDESTRVIRRGRKRGRKKE